MERIDFQRKFNCQVTSLKTVIDYKRFKPFQVQWISVNWDSDKGDFWLIGIEIEKPYNT